MSSFRTVKIKCPNCNSEDDFTVWDSVNVDLDPELRVKVMDGSIFKWTCPNCRETFNAPYMFLYHNMTKNFMIYFDPKSSHIIPFAEHLRILENDLDPKIVARLAELYREDHEKENILFEEVTDGNRLLFCVYEMPDGFWEKTDRTYEIPSERYDEMKSELAQSNDGEK